MKKLILLRHAKSSWDLNVSDKDRPLTEKGINRIKMISAHSSNILSSADLIFTSPANRATHTSCIMISSLGLGFDKILQVGSGAIIGTAAGFTHVWAPTIAVLLVIRKANKEQFVALTGLFIFVGSTGLFFTHYLFDLLDQQSLIFSTLMIIPSIVGFLIGEKIRSFISEKLFETLLMVFLLIASTNLLYKSDFISYFMKAFCKS